MSSIVSAKNIIHTYPGDSTRILNNLNLTIPQGAFSFIVGTSGSGKTTLLKTLYGELLCQSGDLTVCGIAMKNIKEAHLRLLRHHLGIVFQDYKLIDEWTIEENVALPLKIQNYSNTTCKRQVEKVLSHVKLLHKSKRYPYELSGGEQQRIGLARAIAHNPLLIIADEPTGNLDAYSSDVIWNLLINANRHLGTSVIVATHQLPSLKPSNYLSFRLTNGQCFEE
jgi:cell division transport system ATP-binding protein